MKYPRTYDISLDARIVLRFYVNGVRKPTSFDLNDFAIKQLMEREYIKIEDGKVVVLIKNPRVFKRDNRGNIIPMARDKGKHVFTWK